MNRAGQSLIRQLDSPDEIEKELDELSDRYYELVDKTKDKKKVTKDTLSRVKQYVEIIEVLEVWIEEILVLITKQEPTGSDPDSIKKQLKAIEVCRS